MTPLVDHDLVSCLMVTQASRWADGPPIGVLAYQAQSYSARELVIVTSDPCDEMDTVGFDVLLMPKGSSLGAMRQRAVQMSSGAYVATWDDDDRPHYRRLEEQIATLAAMPLADACLLLRVTIDDQINGRQFTGPLHAWEMTMVARRESVGVYPDTMLGEDSAVIRRMKQVVVLDRPELYVHTAHPGSTFGKKLVAEWFANRTGGPL